MLMIIPSTLLEKMNTKLLILEIAPVKLFKWFHKKGIKAKQDKCHFFSSLDITTKLSLPDCPIDNYCSEKVLGVILTESLTSMSMLQICAIKQVRKLMH